MRVGTFQFFAARSDQDALRILTDHALARHYPDSVGAGNAALALLDRVIDAQAQLVARWLGIGFVHGVMNTDNTAISGETIDYGPCAFLDEFDPSKTFSSIDHHGRYAFSNQPRIALWNLSRLGETLLPLVSEERETAIRQATERLERFPALFEKAYLRVMRAKLGLFREEKDDRELVDRLLAELATHQVDYTIFFRRLSAAAIDPSHDQALASSFEHESEGFVSWAEAWRRRLALESETPAERRAAMERANPAFIPRNHRVEEAIDAAVSYGDFTPFETLVGVLGRPFEDQPENAHLAEPPEPEQRVYQTFCGT